MSSSMIDCVLYNYITSGHQHAILMIFTPIIIMVVYDGVL